MFRTADDSAAAVIGFTDLSLLEFEFIISLSTTSIALLSFMDAEPIRELKKSGGIIFNGLEVDATLAWTDAILVKTYTCCFYLN